MLAHTETVIIKSYRDIINQDSNEMPVKAYDSLVTLEAEAIADAQPDSIERVDEVLGMIENSGSRSRYGGSEAESIIIVTYKDNTKEYYLSINNADDYEYRKYFDIHPYYVKKNYQKIHDPLTQCTWWMTEYLLMKGYLSEEEEDEEDEEDEIKDLD
jgi:hypothetical protein